MELNVGFYKKEICLVSDILIPVDNLAVGRAYAAYEFFRIHRGRPFYIDRHLKRLFTSLDMVRLKIDYSVSDIETIVNQLIVENQQNDFYLKLYVVPNAVPKKATPSDLFIIPVQLPDFHPDIYLKGTTLLMKEYARFLPEAKSTNYIASVFWQDEMDEIQAVDVLFTSNGLVLESSRGNVFVVKNNVVYTPSDQILKGITRSIVFDLMNQFKIEYKTGELTKEFLLKADEVFITSTTKRIMPIVKVNERMVGNGNPGPVALKVLGLYNALLA